MDPAAVEEAPAHGLRVRGLAAGIPRDATAVSHGMRALLAITFLTSSAMADPANPAPGSVGTGNGSAIATLDLERPRPDTSADRGGDPGILVVPEPVADAQPYPRGMVIAPPEVGDRMAIALARPWLWSSRSLWQRLEDSVGAVWNALQSPHL